MQHSWLLLSHFHCHQQCTVESNKHGISKPVSPPSLPHFTRGITTRCRHPLHANHIEKTAMVSLPVVFMFSSLFLIFSHHSLFQINISSVDGINGPPSVHNGNNSPLPLSPTHKCHREASNSEFVCYFYFPPFPIFSLPRLFQLICYSVGCVGCPPSVHKANNSRYNHSHSRGGEGSDGEFPHPFYFPPTIPNVFSPQRFSI